MRTVSSAPTIKVPNGHKRITMSAKPDHELVVKKKDAEYWSKIGVAWTGEWGISIRLNPCVQLTDRDDIYIKLRPIKGSKPPVPWPIEDETPSIGDDVPF